MVGGRVVGGRYLCKVAWSLGAYLTDLPTVHSIGENIVHKVCTIYTVWYVL